MTTIKKNDCDAKHPDDETPVTRLFISKNVSSHWKNLLRTPEEKDRPTNCGHLKDKKSVIKKAERKSSLSKIVADELKRYHLTNPPHFKKDNAPPCHKTKAPSIVDEWNYEFAKKVAEVEQSLPSVSEKEDPPPLHSLLSSRKYSGTKFDKKRILK